MELFAKIATQRTFKTKPKKKIHPENISYFPEMESSNSTIKKYLIFREMELSSSNINKVPIFREMEFSGSKIFSKESFCYISGTENPETGMK